MGIAAGLSSELVRQAAAEEVVRRAGSGDETTVRSICRRGAGIGSVIERFQVQERCMDIARQRIRQCEMEGGSFPSGAVFLADELRAGRGRFKRVWHAPVGGLWMTVVIVNTLLPAGSRLYPLAAGLACCETVRRYGIDARLKWVNDVLVGGRKICGVLAETMIGPRYGEEYVLVGIGVNVNNDAFPPELAGSAVAMKTMLGGEIDMDLFAARLLAAFSWWEGLLHHEEERRLSSGGGEEDGPAELHPLIGAWSELSDSFGRRVLFGFDVQHQPLYEAMVTGIAPDGGLRLRLLADGAELVEQAGEIVYLD